MKIRIITISKKDEPGATQIYNEYIKRLKHYGTIETIAIKSSNPQDEALAVLKKLSGDEELILLDEEGHELTSLELSSWLEKKMNGSKNLCFVIGSAYGHDDLLKDKCAALLSLSKMTLPHQLAKVVFVEQLYRAYTIIRNEKYHH